MFSWWCGIPFVSSGGLFLPASVPAPLGCQPMTLAMVQAHLAHGAPPLGIIRVQPRAIDSETVYESVCPDIDWGGWTRSLDWLERRICRREH